jgi:hypothetical protein
LTSTPSTTPEDNWGDAKSIHEASTASEEDWPTTWKMIDCIQGVEVKQIHPNHFVLRNATHEVTLTRYGFNLYRTGTKDFEKFLDEFLIQSVPRTPDGY